MRIRCGLSSGPSKIGNKLNVMFLIIVFNSKIQKGFLPAGGVLAVAAGAVSGGSSFVFRR